MLRVSLEQWRMFQAVVDHGGFNQASAAIHKSQSSIHSAVSKIEQSLGVKLFRVEGRKTLLTEQGEMLLRRAATLLDEAEKVEAIGATLARGIESNLRISVEEIFPQQALYEVLEQTSAEYPYLHIEISESILTGATELVDTGEAELAISPFPLSQGSQTQLCEIDFIAVAAPNHPLAKSETPLTEQDLRAHRQIVVRDSAVNSKRSMDWLNANQRWTVTHMRTSIDLILNGFGFARLPVTSIAEYLQDGRLVPLNIEKANKLKAALYLVYKDYDSLGPAAKSFCKNLLEKCKHLPTLDCIEPE